MHNVLQQPAKRRRRLLIGWIGAGVVLLLVVIGGTLVWYNLQLAPVNTAATAKTVVKIEAGSTPGQIAQELHAKGLIRSPTAFLWYARLQKVENNLQAGSYRLSAAESTAGIVDHLVKGKTDTFLITFLPGSTLAQNRRVLLDVGYSATEVDAALAQSYNSPLFDGKPITADLEGYIYGETYSFATDTPVTTILTQVFEQFYSLVQQENLKAKFAAQGLSLYQGITLASIVQREASAKGDEAPQIAQVFYLRLATNMPLGSDVTYQYIADKTGVARDPNIDSPYNTRRYAGLPPGPIAVPGKVALMAVAQPASGDYVYFLSGDDDVTYFARTLAEHEANIANHCQKKCQIL